MNDNDRDLIIDLISGNLSPEEAAAAEARIAASPELSAEAAAQRFALTELATQAKPRLSAEERTALRADVAAALHLTPAAAPVAAPRRRVRWLAPLAGLATAAVMFFGIVVVSGGLGGSDDSAEEVAAAAEVTTTAAAGEQFAAEDAGDAAVSSPPAGGDEAELAPTAGEAEAEEGEPQLVTPQVEDRSTIASTMAVPEFPEGLPPAAQLYTLLEDSEFSLAVFNEALLGLGAEGVTTVSTESANDCRGAAGDRYDTFHVVAAATPDEQPQTASYLFHSAEAGDQVVNLELDSCTVLDSATGDDS
jgi:anti-sigma factor RsiW